VQQCVFYKIKTIISIFITPFRSSGPYQGINVDNAIATTLSDKT